MSPRSTFGWGALGALFPEIARIYRLVTGDGSLPDFGWAYLFISLAFVIAAGFMTVAWKPESQFKAVWVGVSFPVIVSTLAQAAPPVPQ